jgi:VanZ family protein
MQVLIRRPLTIASLFAVTVAIAALTLSMSGRSYGKVDPIPFEDVRHLIHRMQHRQLPTSIVSVIVMPMVANLLLFVPWGFLMFISLYTANRPTVQTYVLTVLLGFSFSVAIEAAQYFMPTRVADVNDIIWNTAGAISGALLGHARLRLRFEFE